jgi:hypothetical protein
MNKIKSKIKHYALQARQCTKKDGEMASGHKTVSVPVGLPAGTVLV